MVDFEERGPAAELGISVVAIRQIADLASGQAAADVIEQVLQSMMVSILSVAERLVDRSEGVADDCLAAEGEIRKLVTMEIGEAPERGLGMRCWRAHPQQRLDEQKRPSHTSYRR